jgi:hypothetical protein
MAPTVSRPTPTSSPRRGWLTLALVLAACSDSGAPSVDAGAPTPLEAAAPTGCALGSCPVNDDVPEGPEVSFRRDLLVPIQRNCSDAPCHGRETGGGASLFLSPPVPAVVDATLMIERLVGVASQTAPELALVAPGSPSRSFLVLKVEGCQNASLGITCRAQPGARTTAPCGDTMPQAARPLCNADRELLRRWIQQGARDN